MGTKHAKTIDDYYDVVGSCWEWSRARDSFGYGWKKHKGKMMRAHRWMYQMLVGDIPEGMFVLHSCDNPPCVNPDHLRIGTKRDNAQDREERGRGASRIGEKNNTSKLKESDIANIRNMRKLGYTNSHIADIFGVGKSAIQSVISGKSWRHIK